MIEQSIVQQNIQTLQQVNLNEFISFSTVREFEGKLICYANLLVEQGSGKILRFSPCSQVFFKENAISTPVSVISALPFGEQMPTYLEVASKEELEDKERFIIEESLKEFNQNIRFLGIMPTSA